MILSGSDYPLNKRMSEAFAALERVQGSGAFHLGFNALSGVHSLVERDGLATDAVSASTGRSSYRLGALLQFETPKLDDIHGSDGLAWTGREEPVTTAHALIHGAFAESDAPAEPNAGETRTTEPTGLGGLFAAIQKARGGQHRPTAGNQARSRRLVGPQTSQTANSVISPPAFERNHGQPALRNDEVEARRLDHPVATTPLPEPTGDAMSRLTPPITYADAAS